MSVKEGESLAQPTAVRERGFQEEAPRATATTRNMRPLCNNTCSCLQARNMLSQSSQSKEQACWPLPPLLWEWQRQQLAFIGLQPRARRSLLSTLCLVSRLGFGTPGSRFLAWPLTGVETNFEEVTQGLRSWHLTLARPTPGSPCNIQVVWQRQHSLSTHPAGCLLPVLCVQERHSFSVTDEKTTSTLEEGKSSLKSSEGLSSMCLMSVRHYSSC